MTHFIHFTPGLRILHSLCYAARTANQVRIKIHDRICVKCLVHYVTAKKYFKTTCLNISNAFKIMRCPSQVGKFHISLQFSLVSRVLRLISV